MVNLKQYIKIALFISISLFYTNCLGEKDVYRKELKEFYNLIENKQLENMPLPLDYAELKPILNALYKPKAIQIKFRRVEKITENNLNVITTGKIWFSEGKLYIRLTSHKPLSDEDEIGYNYVTINDQVYKWREGDTGGRILKRSPCDTLKYLLYYIDRGALKAYAYTEYKENPNQFIVSQNKNEKEILYKGFPESGFLGMSIVENPFWLKSIYFSHPEGSGKKSIGYEFDIPIEIEEIPDEVLKLPEGIKWTHVDDTLENWLRYL